MQRFIEELSHTLASNGVWVEYDTFTKEFEFVSESGRLSMDAILETWQKDYNLMRYLSGNGVNPSVKEYMQDARFALQHWIEDSSQ